MHIMYALCVFFISTYLVLIYSILVYIGDTGGWSFYCNVDKEEGNSKSNSPVPAAGGISAARELFRNKTARGQDLKVDTDTLRTVHERAITLIQDATLPGQKSGCISRISTSSLDGRLVVWDLPALDIDMASLTM